MASFMLSTSCCSVMAQWPTATFRQSTFFSWNLTMAFISSTLDERSSDGSTTVGNLPALFRPGPSRRGICLISDSEDADAELGAGDVRQLDGAGEALVLLRVVVLK